MTKNYLEALTVNIVGDCINYRTHNDEPEAMRRLIQFQTCPSLDIWASTTHVALRDVLATLEAACWGDDEPYIPGE